MATKHDNKASGVPTTPRQPAVEVGSMEELLREVLTAISSLLEQHLLGNLSDELFTHTLRGLVEYANKRHTWLLRGNQGREHGKAV